MKNPVCILKEKYYCKSCLPKALLALVIAIEEQDTLQYMPVCSQCCKCHDYMNILNRDKALQVLVNKKCQICQKRIFFGDSTESDNGQWFHKTCISSYDNLA